MSAAVNKSEAKNLAAGRRAPPSKEVPKNNAPGNVVANAIKKREWPDTIQPYYAPMSTLKEEWQRLVVRASASQSEAEKERQAMLRRCHEQWKQQLIEVEQNLKLRGAALATAFQAYRSGISTNNKKDQPRTEEEFSDSLRFQHEYLSEALKFMQLSRVDEPKLKMKTSKPLYHEEWPETVTKYRTIEKLTQDWDQFVVLAGLQPSKDVQIQQGMLKNLRAEFAKALLEAESLLKMNVEQQQTAWTIYQSSKVSGGRKSLPNTFEQYLDSLHWQVYYFSSALAIMDMEEKSAAEVYADGKTRTSFRSSQSTCSMM